MSTRTKIALALFAISFIFMQAYTSSVNCTGNVFNEYIAFTPLAISLIFAGTQLIIELAKSIQELRE